MLIDKEQLKNDLQGWEYKDIKQFKKETDQVLNKLLEKASREKHIYDLLQDKSLNEVLKLRKDFTKACNRYLKDNNYKK